jgi:hypothetical protein
VPIIIGRGAPAQVISFVASSLYTDYVLGIQTTAAAPKPDYFAFSLPTGVVSGGYSINNTGTSATGAVLYGHFNIRIPRPGPGSRRRIARSCDSVWVA